MFNARDLLGQIMRTAMTETTAQRMRDALGSSALGRADSPLAQVFGESGQGSGVGGALAGFAGMAESMLGDAGHSVQRGQPLAVAQGLQLSPATVRRVHQALDVPATA